MDSGRREIEGAVVGHLRSRLGERASMRRGKEEQEVAVSCKDADRLKGSAE